MQVNRLSYALGAEVIGIDVASVSDDDFEAVHAAWLEYEVLVFRDQELTPEQHIAFSKRFGNLEVHISVDHLLEGYPEIMMVSNKQENGRFIGAVSAGDYWHSDQSCNVHPTKASLLYSLELRSSGGDTEWADMYAAYETLPDKTKQRINGLRGIHSWNRMRNPRVHVPEVHNDDAKMRYGERAPDDLLHPIVRTHPETGRKALYVSPRFTLGVDGLESDEAQELLGELFAHQARRDFVFHHNWSLGDLVLWNNLCTVNFACGGHTEARHMHRTSVAGDVPF
jgi:taurine dioxygenase